jgi:thiosulfate/3-mercaptopyruvate sulfurtransferase
MTKTLLLLLVILAALLVAQPQGWNQSELLAPADLAARLKDASRPKPLLIEVSFPVLYRARRIPDAVFAGPGGSPQGLEMLRKAVAGQPKTREIVLYCGCCPFDRCPNVGPALEALRGLGYQKVRVLHIPTNLVKDWIEKGYPIYRAAQAMGR